ncbi:MAG: hypothetical protein FJX68_01105 [Alphaproteobacteria bacterium]|nr:hypothetical protein [Alphaproteobacteria bacterium]
MQNAPQPAPNALEDVAVRPPARGRARPLQWLLSLCCGTGIGAAGLWQSELVFWYTLTASTTAACIGVLWQHGDAKR